MRKHDVAYPSTLSTDSNSSVQVGWADYEDGFVAPCYFSQENIGSEGLFLPDSPNIFQFLSNPEFKDVHDLPQQYYQDQGHEEVKGGQVKESKGQQPLQERQDGPPKKCAHDFAGKRRASERKRRKRINAKLKTLQALIPRSEQKDQASILDEAINYIQSLKLQVDMMSPRLQVGPMAGYGLGQFHMGSSGCPLMVGPTAGGFQVQHFSMQPQVAVTPAALFYPQPQFFPK